jgi:hypothetical protein
MALAETQKKKNLKFPMIIGCGIVLILVGCLVMMNNKNTQTEQEQQSNKETQNVSTAYNGRDAFGDDDKKIIDSYSTEIIDVLDKLKANKFTDKTMSTVLKFEENCIKSTSTTSGEVYYNFVVLYIRSSTHLGTSTKELVNETVLFVKDDKGKYGEITFEVNSSSRNEITEGTQDEDLVARKANITISLIDKSNKYEAISATNIIEYEGITDEILTKLNTTESQLKAKINDVVSSKYETCTKVTIQSKIEEDVSTGLCELTAKLDKPSNAKIYIYYNNKNNTLDVFDIELNSSNS